VGGVTDSHPRTKTRLSATAVPFCGPRYSMLILNRAIQCLLPPWGTELKPPTLSIYHFDLHSPHTGRLADSRKVLQKYGESKVIRVAWHACSDSNLIVVTDIDVHSLQLW
jgi:hypothetical protein